MKHYENYKECKTLLELNKFIHEGNELFEYHMAHINLVGKYARLINKKLGNELDNDKLMLISLSHDLFKERSLNMNKIFVPWNGHLLPQDTNRYVRLNLQVLEEYGLDDYFNTDIQLHALSAGIFMRSELNIMDREILYPIMFHSCPIIDIYETLSITEKTMVDVIMLADKLSSNYLKINMRENISVRIDLDRAVFGENGKEFNYTLGLYLAKLIGRGSSKEKESVKSSEYYLNRLCELNPIINPEN